MHIDDFDYQLPEGLIAQHPAATRDQSRLMVLDRAAQSIEHCRFFEISRYLRAGDALVLNRTRVIPARMRGQLAATGGQIELLLIRYLGDGEWLTMARPGKRLRPGTGLSFAGEVSAEVTSHAANGRWTVRFDPLDITPLLCEVGEVPLPPYIRRPPGPEDASRYQTVYAREAGAVAAPTAGLHFTEPLLQKIVDSGVTLASILLHVGPGTFEPVRTEDPRQHLLEPEFCEIDERAADDLNGCRRRQGRIVAVGTTVARTLESRVTGCGQFRSGAGWTDKYIYPPHTFRGLEALLTNFHLPRSSLLMMVAAFAGTEFALAAYRNAVRHEYRFYSYGDAMLIL